MKGELMYLLDQEAPGLANKLGSLSSVLRQRVLVRVAVVASGSINELEPSIRQLLDDAVKESVPSIEQIAELHAFILLADDKYFTAQEQGAKEKIWKNWFFKARLASALANIFESNAVENSVRAAYELCFTNDDKRKVVNLIEEQIRVTSVGD